MPEGFDVFLSHNSRDKPVVEEIAALLKTQGLTVWLDKWELRPGFPWQEGLEEGIQAARAGAVFIGVEGLGPWQEPEARAFIARSRRERIPVIPVLLPGCPESPRLTVFLDAFTWVDLREGLTEEGLARLVWAYRQEAGRSRLRRTRSSPRLQAHKGSKKMVELGYRDLTPWVGCNACHLALAAPSCVSPTAKQAGTLRRPCPSVRSTRPSP